MKKVKKGYYLNELVTIIREDTECLIEYEDGVQEIVARSLLDSIFTPVNSCKLKIGTRTPIRRKKRLKSNKKRKQQNFKKHFHSEERVLFIKSLPCLVCGRTPSDNAHFRSRGAGGTFRDIIPLCNHHHKELDENLGRTKFETKYDLNLELEATKICKLTSEIIMEKQVKI